MTDFVKDFMALVTLFGFGAVTVAYLDLIATAI